MTNPISPVIVTFKAFPRIRLLAIPGGDCPDCRIKQERKDSYTCELAELSSYSCSVRDYHWREVPPKEGK